MGINVAVWIHIDDLKRMFTEDFDDFIRLAELSNTRWYHFCQIYLGTDSEKRQWDSRDVILQLAKSSCRICDREWMVTVCDKYRLKFVPDVQTPTHPWVDVASFLYVKVKEYILEHFQEVIEW